MEFEERKFNYDKTSLYYGQVNIEHGLEEGYGVLMKEEECLKVYYGQFKYGCIIGKGIAVYQNQRDVGEKYKVSIGNWVNGKLHGQGTCYIINHVSDLKNIAIGRDSEFVYYEGEFVQGDIQGKGKLHYSNGEAYEGIFKDNQINGIGEFRHNIDFSRFEGIMESRKICAFITEFGQYCDEFYDTVPFPKEQSFNIAQNQSAKDIDRMLSNIFND
mmetsp:Transcript_29813/g.26371  ORF Transcript_29813/g.26371 Transcript_29813/m.26371 type:complete len:215 (+) Transcript_29813:672-1316(+)